MLNASEVQEVRKELVAIRNKVNILLDAIDGHPKQISSNRTSEEDRKVITTTSNSSSSQDTVIKGNTPSKKGVVSCHTILLQTVEANNFVKIEIILVYCNVIGLGKCLVDLFCAHRQELVHRISCFICVFAVALPPTTAVTGSVTMFDPLNTKPSNSQGVWVGG